MRKLYEEYFHVPKHGKIRENVILSRISLAVFIIVACLAAMSISAYAYFSHNVTSGSNVIKAANFVAEISVLKGTTEIFPESDSDGINKYHLQPGNYVVNISKGDPAVNTASTGFCIVLADGKEYHTQQIGVDVAADGGTRNSVSFVLNVQTDSVVEIRSHWGTSSHYRDTAATPDELYIGESNPLRVIQVGSVAIESPAPAPAPGGTGDPVDESSDSAVASTDAGWLEGTTGSFSGGTESGSSVDTGTPSDTSSAAGETSDAA